MWFVLAMLYLTLETWYIIIARLMMRCMTNCFTRVKRLLTNRLHGKAAHVLVYNEQTNCLRV